MAKFLHFNRCTCLQEQLQRVERRIVRITGMNSDYSRWARSRHKPERVGKLVSEGKVLLDCKVPTANYNHTFDGDVTAEGTLTYNCNGEESDILPHSQPPQTGVPSGFKAIDRVTSGWQPSDLILVAARPSMGKTAFGLSVARNIAVDHECGVAFFSLEMSTTMCMMRLITAETGLPSATFKSGLIHEQREHLKPAVMPLDSAPLYIDDTPALSVVEFRSKARRVKMLHDVKVIIIDYLQLMVGNAETKNGSREQEGAFILRTLKETAKELDVPIIVLSQLNLIFEKHDDLKRPYLSDLRESGVPIIEHADVVAFIHRPEYYGISKDDSGMPTDGLAEFIIAKHPNGALCNIKLRFQKERVRFTDIDGAALSTSADGSKQQTSDEDAGSPTRCGGS